jgi:threonine aldolase
LSEALHQRGWHFYSFIGAGGARLMCSWATLQTDIEALVEDIQKSA